MAIKQEEYESIVKYIQDRMMANSIIPVEEIVDIATYASYDQYIADTKKVKKAKPVVSKEVEEAFLKFWAVYPATSKFTYKGKIFQGERSLKSNKSVCLKLYNDAVLEVGKNWSDPILTGASMIHKALQVQLEHIKIESYKKGDNRMQYLKSCEVYLRQKAYEPWLGEEFPVDSEQSIYTEA